MVSNEYEQRSADVILRPKYLQGIQLQEAKYLLERYDYLGLNHLFKLLISDWEKSSDPLENKIRNLLEIANQWNGAKFAEFATARGDAAKARSDEWWWTAYEAAYLGVVRLNQGNPIEAMFHSFRAVEGLLAKWVDEYHFSRRIGERNDKIQLPKEIVLPNGRRTTIVNAYGKGLYWCLKTCQNINSDRSLEACRKVQPDRDKDEDIWVFGEYTLKKKNQLFHQLFGLEEIEVFGYWYTDDQSDWEARVLGCLNFLSEQYDFTSLKDASLMSQVHEELKDAIAQYELTL